MVNEKIKTYNECNADEKEVLDSFRKMKLLYVHVRCRVSGTGHIRLRLRHKKHTGGKWINRDPQRLLIQLQVM